MARFSLNTRKGNASSMRVVNKNTLLAFFDFNDKENGLTYRGFRLLEGTHGRFINGPMAEPYKKDGKTVYPAYVEISYDADADSRRNPDGEDFFAELLELASSEYDKLNKGERRSSRSKGADDEDDYEDRKSKRNARSAPSRSAPSRRPPDDDDDDDGMPF